MQSEVFTFQENFVKEDLKFSSLSKPTLANKIYFFSDDVEATEKFRRELTNSQSKSRTELQSFNYSTVGGKELNNVPKSAGSTWSIVVLPNCDNPQDFNSSHWHKVLNMCCKSSKAVFVLSLDEDLREDSSTKSMVANAAYGSLLCAQWEYPQCLLRLLRFQSSDDAIPFSQDPKKVLTALLHEVAVGASNKRLEVLVAVNEANRDQLSYASQSYVKVPEFSHFLSESIPYSSTRETIPDEKPGVFLITGGLGSLGLVSAHTLLDYGFRRLALLSRSGKASASDAGLEQTLYTKANRYGAIIKVYCCDVTKQEELLTVLHQMRSDQLLETSRHPLKGVIHSAGILRDGMLCSGKAESGANEVWATKITSASLIQETISTLMMMTSDRDASNSSSSGNVSLSEQQQLFGRETFQYFINFSSLAAAVGNVGQASYAAANRALEHVVPSTATANTTTRAWNYNVMNIRWPGIIGSNMGKVFDASLARIMMSLDQVSQLLTSLLTHWDDLLGYQGQTLTPIPIGLLEKLKGSWLVEKFDVKDRLVLKERAIKPVPPPLPAETTEVGLPPSAPPVPTLDSIITQISQIVVTLLGEDEVDADDGLAIDLPLLTMGLDSIMAAEFALELSMLFQLDLPPTFLYNYPTIESIADYVFTSQFPPTMSSKSETLEEVSHFRPVTHVRPVAVVAADKPTPGPIVFPSITATPPTESDPRRDREEEVGSPTSSLSGSDDERPAPTSAPKKNKPSALVFPPPVDITPPAPSQRESSASSTTSDSLSDNPQSTTNSAATTTSSTTSKGLLDDVSIIGLGFDFPNNLQSLSDLWTVLSTKSSTVTHLSEMTLLRQSPYLRQYLERAEFEGETGIDLSLLVKKLQSGHFLTSEQKERFTGSEFKVMVNEAETMDLSQKLLLMNCKKALIDADIYSILQDKKHPRHQYYKNMGVFVGIGGVSPSTASATMTTTSVSSATSTTMPSTPRSIKSLPATPTHGSMKSPPHSTPSRLLRSPSSPTTTTTTLSEGSQTPLISSYTATAFTTSVAAGRISFAFGLEGPCMSIDTACSSSLVALHAARRALQLGECNVAIVAGINLIDEKLSLACAVAGMTSPDGICHTFDSSAEGYGRSEGCGVLILRRKGDCEAEQVPSYGVIRGSAIQQDGASASLTAPNGLAQESVIRKALQDARVAPESIRLLEAHGTGTQYGDPVEVTALVNVFGQTRDNSSSRGSPLYVTAVKANLGHLEACAGMAGIFSTILAFQQGASFPNAQLREMNPIIQKTLQKSTKAKDGAAIVIGSEGYELSRSVEGERYLAGISSFGYSGTIAHVILEEPVENLKRAVSTQRGMVGQAMTRSRSLFDEVEDKPLVLSEVRPTLSTKSNDAMEFAKFFFGGGGTSSKPVVPSTDDDRVGQSPATPLSTSDEEEEVYIPSDPHLLWQFSGQGNLKVNAGWTYYQQNAVYREMLAQCASIVQPWLDGVNILDILYPLRSSPNHSTMSLDKASELLSQTQYGQVILISLEYALARSLLATGEVPAAVTGHSLGEYTAAMVAGLLPLEEGLRLVTLRGQLIGETFSQQCQGQMVAIRWAVEDLSRLETSLRALPLPFRSEVAIAGVNGYQSLVLSGSERAIQAALKQLKITTSVPLAVKHAFHSPLLQAIVPRFTDVLQDIHWQQPISTSAKAKKIAYFSTYLGREVVDKRELMTPEYWIGHMIERVNYVKMIEAAVLGTNDDKKRYYHLKEIGPETVLMKLSQSMIKTMTTTTPTLFEGIEVTNRAVLG